MPVTHLATGSSELLAEQDGAVLTLTMNRPEARNALTLGMLEALAVQLQRAEADDSVRCVVLTGAGKGFCSGGDVKGFAASANAEPAAPDAAIRHQRRLQHATAGRLHRMPKPTIAAINGAAAGAGLALALACDLRIMADTAIMTTAFARVGLSGDFGGTYFLTHLVGFAKARELYFTSSRVDAAEALRLGLANWVSTAEAFQDKVTDMAATLASGPTTAFGYMKENLERAAASSLEDCMDIEAAHHIHCFSTIDHKSAAAAFVRKDDPIFVGR